MNDRQSWELSRTIIIIGLALQQTKKVHKLQQTKGKNGKFSSLSKTRLVVIGNVSFQT